MGGLRRSRHRIRERADYGARVTGSANYGSMVYVVCQVNNGGWDGGHTQYGRPFTTWAQ
ncbi:hypothetical protein [Streptomyces sp. NPDC003863]